nr:Ig-like domain-containing protein [Bacillus sp. FJAT-49736]
MTDFRAALLLKLPTGLYGFKGDSSFNALQPRLYSGSTTYLRGGGAIAVEGSNATTVIPSNKGENITYTYLNRDGSTLNVLNPTKPTVSPVSDRDTTVKGKADVYTTIFVKSGSKTLGSQSVKNNPNFSVSIPKQKAGTKLTLYAEDAYGNTSSLVTITVLDKTPPARPTINPIGDNQLYISGKAEKGSNVMIKNGRTNIGKTAADSSGKYKVKLKTRLKTGTVITVSATDKAGNQSSSASTKVLDKTPPKRPSVNRLTSKSKSVYGTSEKGSTVYIYKGGKFISKGKANSKGHYKIKIISQKKGTSITIYAKDSSGNKSKSTVIKVK